MPAHPCSVGSWRLRNTLLVAVVFLCMCPTLARGQQIDIPKWTAERDLVIGDQRVDYSFTYILSIAVGGNGDIFVLEWKPPSVLEFSKRGQFVRRFGGRGEGPGEFRQVVDMGLRNDTVWVADPVLRRLTVWGGKGGPPLTFDTRLALPGIQALYTFPDALLSDGSIKMSRVGRLDEDPHSARSIPVIRADAAGERWDTLATDYLPTMLSARRRTGGPVRMTQPIQDEPHVWFSHDGSWWAVIERPSPVNGDRAVFRVTKSRVSGGTVFAREYSFVPEPVERRTIDSLVNDLVATGVLEGDARRSLYTPDYWPPILGAVAARDGRLFLKRSIHANEAIWLVLSPSGEPEAVLRVPAGLKIREADAQHLWGVEVGEYDVQHVARYRIETSTRRTPSGR